MACLPDAHVRMIDLVFGSTRHTACLQGALSHCLSEGMKPTAINGY